MFGEAGEWDGKPCIEVSCQDCRRTAHRAGDLDVVKVLHRYDFHGWLMETEVVRAPSQEESSSENRDMTQFPKLDV
jgi:hypothetical protein